MQCSTPCLYGAVRNARTAPHLTAPVQHPRRPRCRMPAFVRQAAAWQSGAARVSIILMRAASMPAQAMEMPALARARPRPMRRLKKSARKFSLVPVPYCKMRRRLYFRTAFGMLRPQQMLPPRRVAAWRAFFHSGMIFFNPQERTACFIFGHLRDRKHSSLPAAGTQSRRRAAF